MSFEEEFGSERREVSPGLAQEIQSALLDAPQEFEDSCISVGINPEEFYAAMEECMPGHTGKHIGMSDETMRLIRSCTGNGIIIGMQLAQNRMFKAMETESESNE